MVFYKWSTVSQKLEMTNSPYFHSGFGTPLADDPENYNPKGRNHRCFRAKCLKSLYNEYSIFFNGITQITQKLTVVVVTPL